MILRDDISNSSHEVIRPEMILKIGRDPIQRSTSVNQKNRSQLLSSTNISEPQSTKNKRVRFGEKDLAGLKTEEIEKPHSNQSFT
jgi:hypothetical protein